YYRQSILPNQARAYRAVYERYQHQPEKVSFNDVVTAQQTLSTALQTYLTVLAAQWTAVVDVANLLQNDSLFEPSSPYGELPPACAGLPGVDTWPAEPPAKPKADGTPE